MNYHDTVLRLRFFASEATQQGQEVCDEWMREEACAKEDRVSMCHCERDRRVGFDTESGQRPGSILHVMERAAVATTAPAAVAARMQNKSEAVEHWTSFILSQR